MERVRNFLNGSEKVKSSTWGAVAIVLVALIFWESIYLTGKDFGASLYNLFF